MDRHLATVSIAAIFHLFKLIGVRRANEVTLHVVDVAIGVHKILLLLTLDLDASHDDIVFDVDTLLFFLAFDHFSTSNVKASSCSSVKKVLLLNNRHLWACLLNEIGLLLLQVLRLLLRLNLVRVIVVVLVKVLHLQKVIIPSNALGIAFLVAVLVIGLLLLLQISVVVLSDQLLLLLLLLGWHHIESLRLGLKRG